MVLYSIAAWGQGSTKSIEEALAGMGIEAVRAIDSDICFPATAEEYAALGKNAVVMLRSSTAISTELPLRSVYIMIRGVRVPLHRIALFDKQKNDDSSRVTQVSFYLLPIKYMKTDTQVLADFEGGRTGFSLTTFSSSEGLPESAPAFARLDAYDDPTDPDPATLGKLLAREYPDYFD